MKTQRRQEIEADKLSRHMHGFPELVRQNASKVFLAATLVILVIILIRYRMDAARQRELVARSSLAKAHTDLQQLETALRAPNARPEAIAQFRNQLSAQCLGDLGDVLGNTDDSDTLFRAEAYATRGDLYWTLANSPVFPEAATQPSLNTLEPADVLLGKAEADYKHILDAYPKEQTADATAMFGLAAIAENRHNWDDAKKWYDQVDKSNLPDVYKMNAKARAAILDRLKEPVQIGALSTTQPTTQPTVLIPTTVPATQPVK